MTCRRYYPPEKLQQFLTQFDSSEKITLGFSVQNRPIEMLEIGSGNYKVLIWSQMHGNETTTTKALLDFIPWFLDGNQKTLQSSFTLFIIPQLNPDGSNIYSRYNANNIDLNRDAIDQSQPESRILRATYEKIQPDLCLNLHGQRTLYSAGKGGRSASLSFLSPAADIEGTVTPARKKSMGLITAMVKALEEELPDSIGRYDGTFNPNCVGDSFSQSGTATILFEAGHFPDDYQREQTQSYVLKAYKALFIALIDHNQVFESKEYFKIPENENEFCDLILSSATILVDGNEIKNQKIAIQFRETLIDGKVYFLPEMKTFGSKINLRAHKYLKLSPSLQNNVIEFKRGNLIENIAFNELFALKN